MKRPDKDIPVTLKGSYIKLGDNMSFDWERYAKDLDAYIDSQADVVVKTKIVERIYKKLAIECLKKMEAPEFVALEIINAEPDEEDKEIMADIAKII